MQTPAAFARRIDNPERHGPQAAEYTLANGLRVALLEDHSAPVVAMQTWVRFGSADEAPAVAGIAHVFEHMLFKGTERFPHGEIAALIEGAGGTVNAWTSYDETVYHVTLSSRFWHTGFDVLSDAVLYSLFDATELEREKEVVLEELWRGKDNPDREIAERLFALTYTTHPYCRPVIGSEATVTQIGREEMLQVFRTWYVPNNMIFAAVGDFDSAALLQAVEERFGRLPALDLPPRPRPAEPPQTAPRVTAFGFQAEMARVEIAFPAAAVSDAETPALDLLSDILGSGYNSILYRELKRRRDLAHDVYAYNYTPVDRGAFLLAASCVPEHVPAVVRILMQQAQHAATLTLSDAELTAAKTRIISHFVHARETYQGIAEQLGRYALTYGDANYGTRYIEAIAALQLDDLRRAAATFLVPQRANIALLLPQGASLPDRDTVLAWAQEEAATIAGAPAIHLATDGAAQVAVANLPGNRTLIVQTDRKAPLVSIRTVLDGGQRAEPLGKEGLARLCTSVWDRGTELRSAAEIEHDIDQLGATCSATSDRDTLQLSARYLKETFAEGLELYFDVLAHPLFPELEVERERADQLRELESLKENRFAFAFQHFLEAFYAPHPYGNLALGRGDSVASITRDDLLTFHRALLQAPQAVFAVVGDVSVEEVLALFQRLAPPTLFEAAPAVSFMAPAIPARSAPVTHVIPMPGQQTHIIWGFPTVTLHHRDRYPLRVLDTILGGMGGRLFVELRDKKSLAYAVTTLDANALDAGFLALYIGCSPDKEAEALREFARVVHDVQHTGVTAEELERAKTYLEGVLDIGLQGTSQRTAVYGLGALQHGKWNAFQTYLEAVQHVTNADVQRVAQTYLDPAHAVQVILRAQETAC
jgi:zinc protease